MKVKHGILLISSLIILIGTSSCVNVIESIFFKKNGGGTYTMNVDMSGSKSLLETMGADLEEEANNMEKSILSDSQSDIDKLKAIEGISNVEPSFDSDKWVVEFKFDFETHNALNTALSEFFHDEEKDGSNVEQKVFFERNGKKLVRYDANGLLKNIQAELGANDMMGMDPAEMFGDMFYETRLSFERGFKTFDNEEYTKMDNNTLSWKKFIFNKDDNKSKLGVEIKTR